MTVKMKIYKDHITLTPDMNEELLRALPPKEELQRVFEESSKKEE